MESGDKSVSQVQGFSLRDPGIPKDVWVQKGVVPVRDDEGDGDHLGQKEEHREGGTGATDAGQNGDQGQGESTTNTTTSGSISVKAIVFNAIDALKQTGRETYDTDCAPRPVEFEWTAPRKNVSASGAASAPAPALLTTAEREDQTLRATHLEHVMGGRGEFSNTLAEQRKVASPSANTAPPPSRSSATAQPSADPPATTTILYFHGGALYLMDPASHRQIVSRLCAAVGPNTRAMNVRYRLAPQDPFPAALVDALVAYLGLMYPPCSPADSSGERSGDVGGAGSRDDEADTARTRTKNPEWQPVPPSRIVFAGDSAGGNLCMALLQLLMHLQRTYGDGGDGGDGGNKSTSHGPKFLRFNEHMIPLPLPLPAGVALFSPWLDLTRSLPSTRDNAHWDYLPPPASPLSVSTSSNSPGASDQNKPENKEKAGKMPFFHNPGASLNPTPCALWPRVPPRADIYAEGGMLCHPLVSPLICGAHMWRVGQAGVREGDTQTTDGPNDRTQHTCPPVYCAVGQECLTSECVQQALVLRDSARAPSDTQNDEPTTKTAPMTLEYYEAMPHAFGGVFPKSNAGMRCAAGAGGFIRDCTVGRGGSVGGFGFTRMKAKTCEEGALSLGGSGANDGLGEDGKDDARDVRVMPHEEVCERMREGMAERVEMFERAVRGA